MKYVLITGAYGGMGRATTKLFKENGYGVFALDKNVDSAEENIFPIACDITNQESIKNAFNQVKQITDNLYAIIHLAGIYMLDSLVEMHPTEFDKIFKVNVYGAFYINQTFLPMLEKSSRILMITSELAPLDPLPFTGIYGITKSTLDKYAYSLKMELQLLGIEVSVLRAGAVKTNMLGASTTALDRFVDKTNLYKCNATRFKKIVDSVESKNITPEKLAQKVLKITTCKNPKFAYSINRNPLLRLLNILPKQAQFFAIKQVLKENKNNKNG